MCKKKKRLTSGPKTDTMQLSEKERAMITKYKDFLWHQASDLQIAVLTCKDPDERAALSAKLADIAAKLASDVIVDRQLAA